mmetsp:Transcript_41090/g.95184  ORF Transcript_41090/g.95184 Transcript_41090/m.95184 type:complete len:272 (+) Transcript_41090:1-816(+)
MAVAISSNPLKAHMGGRARVGGARARVGGAIGIALVFLAFALLCSSAAPGELSRRRFARAPFAGLRTASTLLAFPLGASGAGGISVAEIRGAALQRRMGAAALAPTSAAVDAMLDNYVLAHPVERPAVCARGLLAAGSWEVVHAPHIERLAVLLGARFIVRYAFDEEATIRSDVRYDSWLVGGGWLTTRGRWEAVDDTTVRIVWTEVWASPGVDKPTLDQPGGPLSQAVQRLGMAAMVKEVSEFSIELLSEELVSFRFKVTDSQIVAAKVV